MPSQQAAITVRRPREEVRRLWETSAYRPEYLGDADAAIAFVDAPGDRGTEIHVDLRSQGPGGPLGAVLAKLGTSGSLAKVKDDLRRFKQHVETGEIPRSDGVPEGERAERKLKQRPAQPLPDGDLQGVGA